MNETFYTTAEVAKLINRHPATVQQMVLDGRLVPHHREGKKYMFAKDEIDRFLVSGKGMDKKPDRTWASGGKVRTLKIVADKPKNPFRSVAMPPAFAKGRELMRAASNIANKRG